MLRFQLNMDADDMAHGAHDDDGELPIRDRLPSSAFDLVWQVAKGRYRGWIVALIIGEALSSTAGVFLPYALSRIVNLVSGSSKAGSVASGTLVNAISWFVVLSLAELVFGRINAAIHMRLSPRLRQYVARSLFHHLQRHSQRYLSENFAGALAARMSETSNAVKNVLASVLTELWPMAITICVASGLLLSAHRWLGVFTIAWAIGFIAVSLRAARTTQPLSHAASGARSHTVGLTVDAVSNHNAVRLFARVDHERERLKSSYAGELATVLRAELAMERVRWFQFGASVLLKVGVVAVSAWLVRSGAISVGEFVMAISLSLAMIAEIRNLSRRFVDLFEWLGNAAHGVRTIFSRHDLVDSPDARDLVRAKGEVEFAAVGFTYAQGITVFEELSVLIPAGQHVGIVGISGSGKSTFVSLLLRLYDPDRGSIRLDQHDLRSLTQDSLHRQIGMIPQDPALFHRSLRDNIRYGRLEASDAEVERAAERARAHEFIQRIPAGYDALVGERGVKLSGGQRQRIAIARVLLKDAPVLILDEATSSLDSLTERAIQEVLDDAMADKTVIVVAHRLSTVAHLDRILVFSEGRIIEDGSHASLLERRGLYHELWSRQAGGLASADAGQTRSAAE